MIETATAHHAWGDRWQTSDGRADGLVPDGDVIDTIPLLRERSVQKVLDLGCGVGRHTIAKPGGLFQATMLSQRNAKYGVGVEIASDTFVISDADDDKSHPRFYCNVLGRSNPPKPHNQTGSRNLRAFRPERMSITHRR